MRAADLAAQGMACPAERSAELLEILAQGGRDTFTDEMRHAIAVAYEKMGVEPMEGRKDDVQ